MNHLIRKTLVTGVMLGATLSLGTSNRVWSAVALPSIFTDHMVLQRDTNVPVWGWADPGEKVVVSIAGQTQATTANDDGRWQVEFKPMAASREPLNLFIEGKNRLTIEDVLVGEVWICSGQSNMQWSVDASWNGDLAILSAKHPEIRLLTVENAGVQVPIQDFEGRWQVCSPETVGSFTAVGYFFGRQLYEVLDVPIGLIDNAWGGSSCEAWVQRDKLEQNGEQYGPLMQRWVEKEAKTDVRDAYQDYEGCAIAVADATPLPPNKQTRPCPTSRRVQQRHGDSAPPRQSVQWACRTDHAVRDSRRRLVPR